MSDNEWNNIPPITEQIEQLERLVQNLKTKALAADNDIHASNIICSENKGISDQLSDLYFYAWIRGDKVVDDLISTLSDDNTDIDEEFWIDFINKLKLFEGTDEDYREKCLHKGWFTRHDPDYENDNYDFTLMHLVCKNNPPVEVVRTLIDIIPSKPEGYKDRGLQFNHLACDYCGRYPLHMIVQYGGSLDVLKLLVDADEDKKTLRTTESYSYELEGYSNNGSVYHMLVENRKVHKIEVFSEMLLYLACNDWSLDFIDDEEYDDDEVDDMEFALLYKRQIDTKTPLELLTNSLVNDELSAVGILGHIGFISLLKASCYHYFYLADTEGHETRYGIEYNVRMEQIEEIPLSRAFIVCSRFLTKDFVNAALEHLLSSDKEDYLMEKDLHGQYPIHRMIKSRSYFIQTHEEVHKYGRMLDWYDMSDDFSRSMYIIVAILKHAPQCAQQVNVEGVLPLHLVCNPNRVNLHDDQRVKLVRSIWEAYPEASEVVDHCEGLPPFAVAAISTYEEWPQGLEKTCPLYDPSDISSSFFLLRENPAILSKSLNSTQKFKPIKWQCEFCHEAKFYDYFKCLEHERHCPHNEHHVKRHKTSDSTLLPGAKRTKIESSEYTVLE